MPQQPGFSPIDLVADSRRIRSVLALWVVGWTFAAQAFAAQAFANDDYARNAIFGDAFLAENVDAVRRQARTVADNDRFEVLADWVLPDRRHEALRLTVRFTPTHPAPPVTESTSDRPAVSTPVDVAAPTAIRVQTGGDVTSPALDLIDAAIQTDRLDELQLRVNELSPDSVVQQIRQRAMQALVTMACDDLDAANGHLDELFALAIVDAKLNPAAREAVLLTAVAAQRHVAMVDSMSDRAYLVVATYEYDFERDPWQRQFSAQFQRLLALKESDFATVADQNATIPATDTGGSRQAGQRAAVGDQRSIFSDTPTSVDAAALAVAQWHSASRLLARNRGSGSPVSRWDIGPGHAEIVSSHDNDYLYFQLPLSGNFNVECDVSAFKWRDSHLMFGGTEVAPVFTQKHIDVGNVRGETVRMSFDPPLTRVKDDIHYRIAVRDSVVTTYFNGRAMHRQPLGADHVPWLALCSFWRQHGDVNNLKITGEPVIPDTVQLSNSPDLRGWVPYFAESPDATPPRWQHITDAERDDVIKGRRREDVPVGCHDENLLYYHRPLIENGAIEYEFLERDGVYAAHPALDRLCFLLDPQGVRIHWLTDGVFDQTSLPPDNLFDEPDNRRGPERLPVKRNDWNRLRLTLTGDVVDLELNGTLIYQRALEPTNQRTFGLFHFADRTSLAVRDVTWRGDWPRELPTIANQKLAVDETQEIDDRLPELTTVFEHDFAKDGLPQDRFAVINGGVTEHLFTRPDGLHATRTGANGYRNATIAPELAVYGDFDIIATYDQLQTTTVGDGASTLMLNVMMDNATSHECSFRRRELTTGTRPHQHILQCALVRDVDGNDRRNYFAQMPMEATAGRLRLARRADRIYFLFAENDSDQFRVIGRDSCPTDPLRANGIQMIAQAFGAGGSIGVVWKSITVRAEQLTGLALIDTGEMLATLNQQRSALPAAFAHDFTQLAPPGQHFKRWGDHRTWNPGDGGLLVATNGKDNVWASAGLSLKAQIEGDFDITSRFDVRKLDMPKPHKHSAVYLQIELLDDTATQVSLLVNQDSDGHNEILAQLRVPKSNGGYDYRRFGGHSVSSVDALRLARRGEQVIAIASSSDFGGERIIAHTQVGDAPLNPANNRMQLHAGGADRQAEVVWQSIDVHADSIQIGQSGTTTRGRSTTVRRPPGTRPKPTRPPAPPAPPKSFLQSVFDYFK